MLGKSIKTTTGLLFMVVLFSIGAFSSYSQESTFFAGAAEVNITPPTGMPIGFSTVSDGVHDSLFARVIIMTDGNDKAAIVNLDLGGNPDEALRNEIWENVRNATNLDRIMYTAIHTHAAAFFIGGGPDDSAANAWRREVSRKLTECILTANARLAPVLVGTGFGQAYINHNRLHVKTDGSVRWLGNGSINFITFPVDPSVAVIRIDDRNGTPIAVLVNYSCHPVVVFSNDNTKFSADFPGAMRKWVRENVAGSPVCFFIQGASGDINPIVNPTPQIENSIRLKDELGVTLGKEVVRIVAGIKTHPVSNARLTAQVKEFDLKMRWNKEKAMEMAKKQYGERAIAFIERMYARDIRAPLTFIVLHNEFGICGFPGEFYVEFQMDLRRRFTDFPLFFAGITGESLGYFPTIRAAVQGGYGSSTTSTNVEVGAGERLVTEAVVELNYITGNLKR